MVMELIPERFISKVPHGRRNSPAGQAHPDLPHRLVHRKDFKSGAARLLGYLAAKLERRQEERQEEKTEERQEEIIGCKSVVQVTKSR